MDIDFDTESQDKFLKTVKKYSDHMLERNIELSQSKELIYGFFNQAEWDVFKIRK